jgi:hypothetical protein
MTERTYTVVNGTSYHKDTDPEVIRVLEHARIGGYRVRTHYGHTQDTDCQGQPCERGRDWLEECDTEGRIGRSMGPICIPIMLHNCRSTGGSGILDHCIVRITRAFDPRIHTRNRACPGRGRVELYRHPAYKTPVLTLRPRFSELGFPLRWEVLRDGGNQARFRTAAAAERYIHRFTK